MGDRTYNDMTRDFFERYNAKDYTGALEILTREGPNFPEQAALTTYNRACVLSLQNQLPETLAVLRQAVDKGYWYSEKMLREDADFTALKGNPDFESLIS